MPSLPEAPLVNVFAEKPHLLGKFPSLLLLLTQNYFFGEFFPHSVSSFKTHTHNDTIMY